MNHSIGKLHVVAFGLAFGIIWGLSMLLLGLLSVYSEYGMEIVTAFGMMYIGFEPTILGSLIGLIWGLIDGFVFGVLLAFVYNMMLKICK